PHVTLSVSDMRACDSHSYEPPLAVLYTLPLHDALPISQLSGGLSVAQFDLRTFLDSIGHPLPATADPAAFGKLELVSRLQGNPKDRKSTRLNSSHVKISYAVFCLKKKKINQTYDAPHT